MKFSWSDMDTIRPVAVRGDPPVGSFNLPDYMQQYGLPPTTGRRELETLVAQGKLESALFLIGGHRSRYYWLVGNGKGK